MPHAEIIQSILALTDLGEVQSIVDAANERKQQLAKVQRFTLRPGDKVRIIGNISPKYLLGKTGVVSLTKDSRVDVVLDEPEGRFSGTRPVGFPYPCVEKVA